MSPRVVFKILVVKTHAYSNVFKARFHISAYSKQRRLKIAMVCLAIEFLFEKIISKDSVINTYAYGSVSMCDSIYTRPSNKMVHETSPLVLPRWFLFQNSFQKIKNTMFKTKWQCLPMRHFTKALPLTKKTKKFPGPPHR